MEETEELKLSEISFKNVNKVLRFTFLDFQTYKIRRIKIM